MKNQRKTQTKGLTLKELQDYVKLSQKAGINISSSNLARLVLEAK